MRVLGEFRIAWFGDIADRHPFHEIKHRERRGSACRLASWQHSVRSQHEVSQRYRRVFSQQNFTGIGNFAEIGKGFLRQYFEVFRGIFIDEGDGIIHVGRQQNATLLAAEHLAGELDTLRAHLLPVIRQCRNRLISNRTAAGHEISRRIRPMLGFDQ